MKQKLFKTLLLAATLLVGGANCAWADSKLTFYSNNFSASNSLDLISVSSSANQTLSLANDEDAYGNYIKQVTEDRTRDVYMTVTSLLPAFFADYTDYTVEFDAAFRSGATNRSGGNSLTLKSTGSSDIFKMATPTTQVNAGDLVFTVTGADAEKTVTLSSLAWYHFKFEITSSTVTYTITLASNGSSVTNGTGTLDITDSRISQVYFGTARYNGQSRFDNIEIYTMTSDLVADAPTFAFSSVSGENRVYTITNPNGEGTLYYTTVSANEAPAVGNAAYSSTTNASANVTLGTGTYYAYTVLSDGTTTSTITSQAVTGGAITLNAPVFTVVDIVLAEDGKYYPKVSFSSDNSALLGSPTATLDVSSPYTFTETGSLTVTASCDGYTSNSATFAVPMYYVLSKTIDFGAMTASDFDENIWESATGAPRDYWTNRAAKIPADATYYKLKSPATTGANAIEGITITNPDKREPQVYIGYGLYTPYNALSGGGNNLDLTVNGATSADYAVFNGWNNYGSGTFNTVLAGNATFGLYRYDTMLRTIKVYSPNPVDVAILDCKRYETSAAFATAVADVSFSTAAEVYAFHTAWQIAQAQAAGSVDITKVIRNAAIADGTDWSNSNVNHNEQFTAAPDNTYLDIWNASMNTNQTIYGVPAGTYKIKAATRAATGTPGTLYVNDGNGDIANISQITNIGNTDGELGNGWSYQEMTFTLTETKNLLIGFWTNASSSRWAGCDDWHMEIAGVPVTLGDLGWATLYTPYALNFAGTGLTAYTATLSDGIVTLTGVTEVPANTGVVLNGAAGNYDIPVIASSSTEKGDLQGDAVNATVVDAANKYYALSYVSATNKVQFNPVANGQSIAAGKAYLVDESGLAKAFTVEFAGADAIDNVRSKMEEGRSEIFNLAGQRMNRLQKGVNIVHGKKILVK